ncbi:MAG: asparagine synthase (glutamine-hydrolyzing) [Longimicrobiaceae bacterium]
MCGIAAILGTVPGGLLEPIRAMGASVRHRGPDDEGYALFAHGREPVLLGGPDTPPSSYAAGLPYSPRPDAEAGSLDGATVALGHRRLSIVDVSPAGHAPLSYRGRYWITYNGEVYNYLELRAELEGLGHRFLSHTDTEVVLAAYHQWGPAALSRMNGMWAFAIADRERRTVFLARDRWGIKPLYYWASPAGFLAFASEIKQFTMLPGWGARMNGQRVYDFLNWRVTDHTAETLFAGVHQLRGGECLELPWPAAGAPAPYPAGEPLVATRWYHLRPAPFSGTFDDAAARFRELLTDSVRLRLRADVPVGSCLSGGLDSSSIVCAMDRLLREGGGRAVQKTFSAYADDPRFDERAYVEEVVRHTAVEPHHVTPGMEGAFDALGCVTWHQDEPFGSTSIYAQWNVFRIARENGVVVMLDGQGADEQLAGYHTFFAPRLAELLKAGRLPTLWSEVRALRRLHGRSPASSAAQVLNLLLPGPAARLARRFAARTHAAPEWLDLGVLGARPGDPFAARGARASSVEELSVAQLTATNLQMLLHWEDRDSMAHSVESRIPFLDYRLVEFVLGLPTAHKIAGGVTKRVQREGMRGVLPERVRARMDKMGFLTAEEAWARERAPARFVQAAREAVEASAGVVRPAAVAKVERIVSGAEPWEPFAWRLISFGAWVSRFGVAA